MKALLASTLFLCAASGSPLLAETTGGSCPLSGPLDQPSADCAALRAAYHARLFDCMTARKDAADQAGHLLAGSAQASRARYLICASETAAELGAAGK